MEYIEHMIELTKQEQTQGVFFFASVYAAVVCLISIIYQLGCNAWRKTEGDLISTSIETTTHSNSPADRDYIAEALYTYTVDGTKYQGKKISAWTFTTNVKGGLRRYISMIPKLKNGRVNVYYKPRNPKKSMLITPGIKSQLATFCIGVAFPVLYFVKYHV
jgi:hypothetical protein